MKLSLRKGQPRLSSLGENDVEDKDVMPIGFLYRSFFSNLLWEVAKHLFGWYGLHLGKVSVVYGSLSALAIFFLWIYYSSVVLILGGEVAFLLEKEKRVIDD